jgi:hypothetical protein
MTIIRPELRAKTTAGGGGAEGSAAAGSSRQTKIYTGIL